MKKNLLFLLVAALILIITAGCSSMQANPGTRGNGAPAGPTMQTAPDESVDKAPEPAQNQVAATEARDLLDAPGAERFGTGTSLKAGVIPNQFYSFQLDSWAVFASWEAAGISAEELGDPQAYAKTPPDGGAILLVTITKTNIDHDVVPPGYDVPSGDFVVVTQSALDEAKIKEGNYGMTVQNIDSGLMWYINTGREFNQTYGACKSLEVGESDTYTIGYALEPTGYEALKAGELYLMYCNTTFFQAEDAPLIQFIEA